jgi:hypothetical protein
MTQGRFNASSLSLAEARHRGLATLAAVGLALVAAGCGGGGRLSKAKYEHRLQQDVKELSSLAIAFNQPRTPLPVLASELKVAQKKLRATAKDLDSVKPPKDVAKDNALLAAGLRRLADDYEPVRQAAEKNDRNLVVREENLLRGSRGVVQARQAAEDFRKKGYTLQSSGS